MDKKYYLCEFDYGGSGQFYLEAQSDIVLRFCNLDNSDLIIENPFGYYIVNPEPFINLFEPNVP